MPYMSGGAKARHAAIDLRVPVIALVFAAIALPIEWRAPGQVPLDYSYRLDDVALNIAGFAPVGVALAGLGFGRAMLFGALLSLVAEGGQFFMAHRDPQVSDVIANVLGTLVGIMAARRWRLRALVLRVGRGRAAVATALAAGAVASVWTSVSAPESRRGVAEPGTLEARWAFDEDGGRLALDSSGHNLTGHFVRRPRRVAGVRGGALQLDGRNDAVNAGGASAFRMAGGMSIAAWINSASYPADDAAIVSQIGPDEGYQLDTTVDKGVRAIGFKLTDSCGKFMARYGATALPKGVWLHVAGTYDPVARAMHVYLNGKLDDGPLAGIVTRRQRSSSGLSLNIGRRPNAKGFEFAGMLDEVRLYSFALTGDEVAADMRGEVVRRAPAAYREPPPPATVCRAATTYGDSKVPLAAAILGALAAAAWAGFRPPGAPAWCVAASLAAGLLLLPVMASTIPPFNRLMMVAVSLGGGLSVALSLRIGDSGTAPPESSINRA
jgi:hypothetical protein